MPLSLSSTEFFVMPAQPFRGRGKKRKAHLASCRRRDLHRARLHMYGSLASTPRHCVLQVRCAPPLHAHVDRARSPGQPTPRRLVLAPVTQPLPLHASAVQLLGAQPAASHPQAVKLRARGLFFCLRCWKRKVLGA
jgi:hypothetical protein